MLTVTTQRTELKLVSLDALKTELQITATDTDDYLSALLDRVSQIVEAYCRRVFAVESVSETLRLGSRDQLLLERYPVVSVETVTELGTVLTAADYEVYQESGQLFRLQSDERMEWPSGKIIVAYTAGYAVIPGSGQQGIFELVKLGNAARTRDPSLKSENILEGLYSYQLFGPSDNEGGLPSNVSALLSPFINHYIA